MLLLFGFKGSFNEILPKNLKFMLYRISILTKGCNLH